jgi:hypothetical protein
MNDQMLTRYLLGELSAEQQAQIEEQLFTDDKCFQQVRALQAELTDNYVRGKLSAQERRQYEARFLSTATGRADATFAHALTQVLAEAEPDAAPAIVTEAKPTLWESIVAFLRVPAFGMGLAMASLLLLLLGGFWWYQQTERLQAEIQQANAAREAEARKQKELQDEIARANARNEELNKQLQQAQQAREQARKDLEKAVPPSSVAPAPANTLLSFLLVPSLVRGDNQRERITIPRHTGRIQMQLDLDQSDNYQSYRAELRTRRGQLLHQQSKLVPRVTAVGKAVFFVAPATDLRNGDYEVALFGVTASGAGEEANYYRFTAVRR